MSLNIDETTYEVAFARTLEIIATGCHKNDALRLMSRMDAADRNRVMADAYADAKLAGVAAEDIDPSWRHWS